MHERIMRLASNRAAAEAFGSALIAYVLASFEQAQPRAQPACGAGVAWREHPHRIGTWANHVG